MKAFIQKFSAQWLVWRLSALLIIRLGIVINECLANGEPWMAFIQVGLEVMEIAQTGRTLLGLKGLGSLFS